MHVIALEYHDIVAGDAWEESGFPGASAATYKLSAGSFAEHVDVVRQSGRRVVNDLAGLRLDASGPPVVAFTFDDGGSGYLAITADLLEKQGWRGHLFMTTSRIGRPGFLSASDLRELTGRGHVIGSHSRNHPPRLSTLGHEVIAEEWRSSVADLQDALGSRVNTASVPGGYYARHVAELAATNGITVLFTSEPERRVRWVGGCAVVGRFTLRRGDSGSYAGRLVGGSPIGRSTQWLQWNAKKVAKVLGGSFYHRVRKTVLKD